MNEVEVFDRVRRLPGGLPPGCVPAHVWHLQVIGHFKADDFTGKHTESGVAAVFKASVEEELQSHADSQKWSVSPGVGHNRLDEPALAEFSHGVTKRTHTGKDEPACDGHSLWITRNPSLGAKPLEGLLNTPQIAAAVIDDGEHLLSVRPSPGNGKPGVVWPRACWLHALAAVGSGALWVDDQLDPPVPGSASGGGVGDEWMVSTVSHEEQLAFLHRCAGGEEVEDGR